MDFQAIMKIAIDEAVSKATAELQAKYNALEYNYRVCENNNTMVTNKYYKLQSECKDLEILQKKSAELEDKYKVLKTTYDLCQTELQQLEVTLEEQAKTIAELNKKLANCAEFDCSTVLQLTRAIRKNNVKSYIYNPLYDRLGDIMIETMCSFEELSNNAEAKEIINVLMTIYTFTTATIKAEVCYKLKTRGYVAKEIFIKA